MPGIFGIISKFPDEKFEKKIYLMQQSMLHESFYSSDICIQKNICFYGGWTCHENSFCDCMPIFNENKDIIMLFWGENFNDIEEIDKLKGKNHVFNKFNASYLVHLYEDKGSSFLVDLNGWFSGIIIDHRNNNILLFNDRYGMQRIYYYEGSEAFFFSSEAKALLLVCPELRTLDPQSLGEFVCCNTVLNQKSLFQKVFLLPGASKWSIGITGVDKQQYFHPSELEDQPLLEKEFFFHRLQELFPKILSRYFRSENKIGISLTGGLDTRMIMSCMENKPGKYPCYTFGSIYRECNDVKVAKLVAETCGQTHQEIKVGIEFLNDFKKFAEKTIYLTDGYLDVAGAPEVYVNSIARRIAPVRMTGNHGSELFRNVRWLKAFYPEEKMFDSSFLYYINEAMTTYSNIKVNHPLTFSLFMEAPWHEYNRLASEQSQLTMRTPYHDNDLVGLMYRAPDELRRDKTLSLRLIESGNPALRTIMTDRGVGGTLPPPFSLIPRLYHEFFFKSEYFYNYGMPDWLATIDYAFKLLHFERIFLGRHKFYHFRVWYRDELANFVKDILLDKKTLNRPYLNKQFVEHIVNSHTRGYKNYTVQITKLLSIELTERLLIENL